MTFSLRSLTFRVVTLSTILAVVAMIAIATVISTLYQNRAQRDFDNILNANLFTLLGAVGLSESGELQGAPNLGDLGFVQRNSGSYWEVVPISGEITGLPAIGFNDRRRHCSTGIRTAV